MKILLAVVIAGALLAVPGAPAQSGQILRPEESAAKAKELLQQAIQALGGQAYLNVRDFTRTGRLATFDRHGELGGYSRFIDFVKLPDKNRTEYDKRRNIITVRTATEGWDMDRGGVAETPADSIEDYNDGLKNDVDNLLRFRLNEEGMGFRYQGADLLDLRRVEWVEVTDSGRRTSRIAFNMNTHLPVRAIFTSRDPVTRQRTEETVFYANHHEVQGIMTPMQEWRERNGRKFYQAFFEDYQYNTGLEDSFFTRESLEQRFAELNKGKKKK